MLVAVYIQEGSHCMRNIVVCQRKYIGDINMSAASGKLLHLMLGNMYLLEDPVDMFQEDAAGFGEDNIAALMFKTSRSIVNSRREKILETVRNDGDVSVSSLSEMLQCCYFLEIFKLI